MAGGSNSRASSSRTERADQRHGWRAGRRPATVKDDQRAGGPRLSEAERAERERRTLDQFEADGNPYYATARLWDDGIVDPLDTRRILGLALATAARVPGGETRFGVFRM